MRISAKPLVVLACETALWSHDMATLTRIADRARDAKVLTVTISVARHCFLWQAACMASSVGFPWQVEMSHHRRERTGSGRWSLRHRSCAQTKGKPEETCDFAL